jgi:hypothetical protein
MWRLEGEKRNAGVPLPLKSSKPRLYRQRKHSSDLKNAQVADDKLERVFSSNLVVAIGYAEQ